MNEKKYIATMDFYFTAVLLSRGFKLIGSDKNDKGVVFIVENKNEQLYEKIKDDFARHDAMVNASRFVKSQARLRAELDKHK